MNSNSTGGKNSAATSNIERISLQIPTALLKDIDEIAKREGRNRSEQIRYYLSNLFYRRPSAGEAHSA